MNNYRERTARVDFHPGDSQTYKWVRSHGGWIAGVCEGLSQSFGLPVWALRLGWVLLALFSLGLGALLYMFAALSLPTEDTIAQVERKRMLGVCLRLSQAFQMEVGLVRILALLMGLASFGITIIGYVILHFVIPERPHPLR